MEPLPPPLFFFLLTIPWWPEQETLSTMQKYPDLIPGLEENPEEGKRQTTPIVFGESQDGGAWLATACGSQRVGHD